MENGPGSGTVVTAGAGFQQHFETPDLKSPIPRQGTKSFSFQMISINPDLMSGYWLMKTEPETYSWEDLVREGKTLWDGVRNYQARNNLKSMKEGDFVLIYHSVRQKSVVGVARVAREHFPDPTSEEPSKGWVAVEVRPVETLRREVSLEEIKSRESLEEIPLVRHTRLSVMPLKRKEFECLLKMGKTPMPG